MINGIRFPMLKIGKLCARFASTQYKLRNYQQVAIDKCIESIEKGVNRIGVSLATGGGKTVIFSNLIEQLREQQRQNGILRVNDKFRTLILVHRRELALQTVDTIKKFSVDTNVQVEMGKYHCDVEGSDIIVASTQSLLNRLEKYEDGKIDLIIIDEAHHAVSKSYLKILDSINASGTIPIVGFSATFERNDNKALSVVFDEIVYHKGIIEMIQEKWLCEGLFTTVDVDVNLNSVDVNKFNDFKIDSLSKVMNTDKINNVIIKTYLKKRAEETIKSTLLFAIDVDHVKDLCEVFKVHGVNAQYVTGDTKTAERDWTIKEFKLGNIEVLINCGIFIEGTDIPNIDCILLCRPTRSRSLLVQMIGRGLRLHHSKQHCHIIDFIGASNVGVISVPSLVGIDNFNEEINGATLSELNKMKYQIDASAELRKSNELTIEKTLKDKYNEYLKNIDEFDLSLTSFSTFESFCELYKDSSGQLSLTEQESSGGVLQENQYFMKSSYPWVKISNTAWAFSIYNNNHIRVYTDNQKMAKDKKAYIVKVYREIPIYVRDLTNIRYIPRELIKTDSFLKAMGTVESFINELAIKDNNGNDQRRPLNINKYSPWRKLLATPKQKSLLQKKLEKVNASEKNKQDKIDPQLLKQFVNKATKGEVSNILFASNLAPIYPLRKLLRIIKNRINQ